VGQDGRTPALTCVLSPGRGGEFHALDSPSLTWQIQRWDASRSREPISSPFPFVILILILILLSPRPEEEIRIKIRIRIKRAAVREVVYTDFVVGSWA
jgi:hypothetical protein